MQQAPEALPHGGTLYRYKNLASTMDEAKTLAESGCPHHTFVLAESQTQARGRQNRPWHSPKGHLYLSWVVRKWPKNCTVINHLCFVVAVAVGQALEGLLPPESVQYKWPNDIWVCNRKCAGILIEVERDAQNQIQYFIVGVGINVASVAQDPQISSYATSLVDQGVRTATVEALWTFFHQRLHHVWNIWHNQQFPAIRRLWLKRAYGLGENICLTESGKRGKFVNINPEGHLILDTPEHERLTISSADVWHTE